MEEHKCVQKVDHDARLIRVVVSGRVEASYGRDIIIHARNASVERGYNIFYDIRESVANISIADLFAIARDETVMRRPESGETKVGILASPQEYVRYYRFYESTAYNAGLNVRSFVKEKEALEWLTREMPKAM